MKVKNLILGFGIFIVFMFLLHNGIRAFYPAPEYEKFCNQSVFSGPIYPDKIPPNYGQNCTYSNKLREQEQQCYATKGQPIYEYDDNGCQIAVKECNYCQRDYDNARTGYNKNVFMIAIVIGIVVIIVGYAILSIEPVGSSLIASGIGAIIYGTMINWENLGSFGRFLLLFIAFALLIWIAIRLNTLGEKKTSFWQKLGIKK